jgi:hypothetical protein
MVYMMKNNLLPWPLDIYTKKGRETIYFPEVYRGRENSRMTDHLIGRGTLHPDPTSSAGIQP